MHRSSLRAGNVFELSKIALAIRGLKTVAILTCGFALLACNHIASHVEGFPELKTTVHESYLLEMNQKCYANLTMLQKLSGSIALGCTVIDFKNKTCDVYIGHNSPDRVTHGWVND